jgi:hypothetical protein
MYSYVEFVFFCLAGRGLPFYPSRSLVSKVQNFVCQTARELEGSACQFLVFRRFANKSWEIRSHICEFIGSILIHRFLEHWF